MGGGDANGVWISGQNNIYGHCSLVITRADGTRIYDGDGFSAGEVLTVCVSQPQDRVFTPVHADLCWPFPTVASLASLREVAAKRLTRSWAARCFLALGPSELQDRVFTLVHADLYVGRSTFCGDSRIANPHRDLKFAPSDATVRHPHCCPRSGGIPYRPYLHYAISGDNSWWRWLLRRT